MPDSLHHAWSGILLGCNLSDLVEDVSAMHPHVMDSISGHQ